jgi:hypothetical protein
MNQSSLRDLFVAISAKHLTPTDANPQVSHGHEIGGLSSMRKCWGDIQDRRDIAARFVYLGNSEEDTIQVSGWISWYDSRKMQESRGPEWRIYYKDNDVTLLMRAGDFIMLAQLKDGSPLLVIAPASSSGESKIKLLFGIDKISSHGHVQFFDKMTNIPLDFQSRYILDALGIEYVFEDENLLNVITEAFGTGFPTTRQFSSFAQEYANGTKSLSLQDMGPDALLLEWYEMEELLFRTLEKKIITQKLERPFSTSDAFIDFAKSVMNRRSARAGFALENHVETILNRQGISYARGAITENKSKPDFIFPSIDQYRDMSFPSELLTMLAVKSSCKDRWRQALTEADRVNTIKHLLTLEPSISINQTNEMQSRSLQLIVPLKLHSTFAPTQRNWLWSFERLIQHLDRQQAMARSS